MRNKGSGKVVGDIRRHKTGDCPLSYFNVVAGDGRVLFQLVSPGDDLVVLMHTPAQFIELVFHNRAAVGIGSKHTGERQHARHRCRNHRFHQSAHRKNRNDFLRPRASRAVTKSPGWPWYNPTIRERS